MIFPPAEAAQLHAVGVEAFHSPDKKGGGLTWVAARAGVSRRVVSFAVNGRDISPASVAKLRAFLKNNGTALGELIETFGKPTRDADYLADVLEVVMDIDHDKALMGARTLLMMYHG